MNQTYSYNIFCDIPVEIQQKSDLFQIAANEKLSQEFQNVFWLISLRDNENSALSYVHVGLEVLENLDNNEILIKELKHLQNVILPSNAILSGFISVQNEKLQIENEREQKFINNLRNSFNSFQDIFTPQSQFICAQMTPQFIINTKNYQDYVNGFEISSKAKVNVSLMKFQGVNDILKQYTAFATYFQYQTNELEDDQSLSSIQNLEQTQFVQISEISQYFQINGGQILDAKDQENQDKEVNSNNKKKQTNKKSKKQKQDSQVDPEIQLKQLIQKKQEKCKDNASEISKNCLSIINISPIEIQILTESYEKTLPVPLVQIDDNKTKNNAKYIQIDHISYLKTVEITQDQSNLLDIIQTHVNNINQKVNYCKQYESKVLQNKTSLCLNYFKFEKQPLFLGCLASENQDKKKLVHLRYNLKQAHPFISEPYRVQNQAIKSEFKEEKLKNVERYLPYKTQEDSIIYKIFGDIVFHHYMQNGFNDNGWGCAYRSCMSVVSWFVENYYVSPEDVQIPSIPQIQKLLIEMGDKEANFYNSSQWIGAFEVSFILQKLLDIECKIIFLQDGSDINTKLNEFKHHFQTEGTPIMFGGDKYAYTLLGIDYNESSSEAKFLILDPHYVGSDQFKNAVDKSGISWKKADLFLPNTFYNFCCPIRPKKI